MITHPVLHFRVQTDRECEMWYDSSRSPITPAKLIRKLCEHKYMHIKMWCSCCLWDQGGRKGMKHIPTPAIQAFLAFFSPTLVFWLCLRAEVSLRPLGDVEEGSSLLARWERVGSMVWMKNKWLLSFLRGFQLGNGRQEGKGTLETTVPWQYFLCKGNFACWWKSGSWSTHLPCT